MSAPNQVLHTVYMVRALLQDVEEYKTENAIVLEDHEKAALKKMLRDIYDLIKNIGGLTKN